MTTGTGTTVTYDNCTCHHCHIAGAEEVIDCGKTGSEASGDGRCVPHSEGCPDEIHHPAGEDAGTVRNAEQKETSGEGGRP